MRSRSPLLAAVAALFLASAAYAGPGGNGNGNGNGAENGNGGNSADAGVGNAGGGAQSMGHGMETSTAAKDPATRGLDKALSVVGTTPAAQQATDSITAAIGKMLDRNEDDGEAE